MGIVRSASASSAERNRSLLFLQEEREREKERKRERRSGKKLVSSSLFCFLPNFFFVPPFPHVFHIFVLSSCRRSKAQVHARESHCDWRCVLLRRVRLRGLQERLVHEDAKSSDENSRLRSGHRGDPPDACERHERLSLVGLGGRAPVAETSHQAGVVLRDEGGCADARAGDDSRRPWETATEERAAE